MAAARHPQPSLLQPGAARSDDPPPERAAAYVCATGPLLVTLGAALFAVTNAASTGLYRRGGTVVTLYLIRAVVVYAANGALTCARDGRAEACRVLQLHTGKVETSRLAVARGLVTAAMALLLNLSFAALPLRRRPSPPSAENSTLQYSVFSKHMASLILGVILNPANK